jgi:hypothetical protein
MVTEVKSLGRQLDTIANAKKKFKNQKKKYHPMHHIREPAQPPLILDVIRVSILST